MSRAGVRARRRRLIESGEWHPAGPQPGPQKWAADTCLRPEAPSEEEQLRLARVLAERDTWLRTAGREGWQREQTRRRAERNARLRQQRLERAELAAQTPTQRGHRCVTSFADLLNPADRARLLERMRELDEIDHIVREPGQNRPPDPPTPLAHTTERTTTS